MVSGYQAKLFLPQLGMNVRCFYAVMNMSSKHVALTNTSILSLFSGLACLVWPSHQHFFTSAEGGLHPLHSKW